jgi:pimeloyl-ACP methyl ester carboxylesterase
MALDHPDNVRGLVLVSGYHYPVLRLDALMAAPVTWPLVGDVMRHTVTAVSARLLLDGMVKGMFAPKPVPPGFVAQLSRELLVRPSQLRADTEDGTFMMPQARASAPRYAQLRCPVTLIAGDADLVVDGQTHSARLQQEVRDSRYVELPGVGHMAHHAAPEIVVEAVSAMTATASSTTRTVGSELGAAAAAQPAPTVSELAEHGLG